MQRNFTQGKITINILLFALPLMAGNLLQQMYNITDTWIVGHYLGSGTLGAVGSAYTLMVFLTSIILGLCMGGGAVVSMQYGENNMSKMRRSIFMSFMFILAATLVLNAMVYIFYSVHSACARPNKTAHERLSFGNLCRYNGNIFI